MYQLGPLHNKANRNRYNPGLTIQPKLIMGQPGDNYEQEADAVADQVINPPQPVEEEEEMMMPKLRMQPAEEDEGKKITQLKINMQPRCIADTIRMQPENDRNTDGKWNPPEIMRAVRGMVSPQREGRRLSDDEWEVVRVALSGAINMVQQTVSFIAGIHNLMLPGADPRLYSPRQRRAVRMFRVHYRNPGPIHALEAQEYYGYMLNALNSLNRASFRAVTQEQADTAPDDNTWAYVRDRTPIIYLSESILIRTVQGEGYTIQYGEMDPVLFARLLIHETSHFRLGVSHRGNDRLRAEDTNCAEGLSIPDANSALQNAYIYGHFPYCVASGSR